MNGGILGELRTIFKDTTLHLSLGTIKKLHVAEDRSFLKCTVEVFPDQRQVIARMTWQSVGPETGFYEFPSAGDLVLIGFTDNEDYAFIIACLSSEEDKIPKNAIDGDAVLKAKKKLWLTSADRINLSKGDSIPSENLVLGQVFKSFMSDILSKLNTILDHVIAHQHIGNMGYLTSAPTNSVDFTNDKAGVTAKKANPIDNGAILSDVSFTEK